MRLLFDTPIIVQIPFLYSLKPSESHTFSAILRVIITGH